MKVTNVAPHRTTPLSILHAGARTPTPGQFAVGGDTRGHGFPVPPYRKHRRSAYLSRSALAARARGLAHCARVTTHRRVAPSESVPHARTGTDFAASSEPAPASRWRSHWRLRRRPPAPSTPSRTCITTRATDFSDKKQIVEALTSSLIATPRIGRENRQPIVVVYGVANQTSEHIDTGGITDDIRSRADQVGEYRFLNRRQRDNLLDETDYQYAGYVAPEQRVAEGRQLGADYILSGTLRSIEKKQPKQWRLKKRKLVYYSMTLEMTDLQSSEIVWADDVEIARESSQPIIGW